MIPIHSKEEFEKMRSAGKLAAQLLHELGQLVKPGIKTIDLDKYTFNFIQKYNIKSACFGYGKKNPFPGYICTSVNHVICHGIPSQQILQEGDIIGIDVTLIVEGYHGDTCSTFPVGKISKEAENLINITKQACEIGISAAQNGNYIGDIGYSIQHFIWKQSQPYAIVTDYCGHGIGTIFHQEPQINHTAPAKTGALIKEGMFFTVEPMINLGTKETRLLQDGWTVITNDYKLSAQFEHTIGIGPNGPEIFTSY